jgi:uncharacterized protein YkwD
LRRIAALIAVSVAVGVALPAAPAAASTAPEAVMFNKINQIRSSHGLKRLRPSLALLYSATRYAHRMMRSDYFGHLARIPLTRRFRRAGETLAWHSGWRLSPRRTVWQWMGSPSHRAVLLSSSFTRLVVGRARGSYGGRRATMWVAHVAKP